jgi:hypothetical protein
MRRVLRVGRQERDAEAAPVAHHRPVFVHRLHAKPDALILAHVAPQILAAHRDVIHHPAETRLLLLLAHNSTPKTNDER